jgi:hypothetical protein
MQEFFELKLGNMTMEEYEKKFLEILRYVGYIRDDKVKYTMFLKWFSCIILRQDSV